jgi:hypothetical protein
MIIFGGSVKEFTDELFDVKPQNLDGQLDQRSSLLESG